MRINVGILILIFSASALGAPPAGWPEGLRVSARESNGTFLVYQDVLFGWDDVYDAYFGIVSDQAVFIHGATLDEMEIDLDGTPGETDFEGSPWDLTAKISGHFAAIDSSSGFNLLLNLQEVIGYEQIDGYQAISLAVSGMAIGVASGFLIMPFATFQNVFVTFLRDIGRS